ncbi:MAG: lysoplasmalogenase [Acidimicrobiia bacterium]
MTWAFTVICLLLLGVLLYYETRRPMQRRYPKLATSAAFVAVGISAGALDSTFGTIMLAGLLLALIGDVFLAIDGRRPFVAGLAVFLAAHLAYAVAFINRGLGEALYLPLLGVALAGAAIGPWLLPTVPQELRPAVVAYIVAISVMVAFAVSTNTLSADWRIPIGAVGFYLSDIFVARDRFNAPGFVNRLVGLPLYYGAQLLLAWAAGS